MREYIARYLRRRWYHFIDSAGADDLARKKVEPELLILQRFLDPAKAFLDVGANAGAYTYVAGKHMPEENIYAFEPQAKLARRLRWAFPHLHVIEAALSDHEGSAPFKVPLINGNEYAARGTLEDFKEAYETGARREVVKTMTLDQAVAEFRIGPVGCIKIDVEGHEVKALAGAENTLHKDHPVLIVEIEQRHHAEPIRTIFDWILSRGYEGFFWDPQKQDLRPLAEFDITQHQRLEDFKTLRYINNFLFRHD